MTTYYKATFSNGQVLARGTTSGRAYTHAWYVKGKYESQDWVTNEPMTRYFSREGFSSSKQLAAKALGALVTRYNRGENVNVAEFAEVAPTIEITSAEYRAIKKET